MTSRALKLRKRSLFPALVTAQSPIVLTKTGAAYDFSLNQNALTSSLAGTFLTTSSTDIVSNKTFDNTTTLTIKDANFTVQDNSDTTKQLKLELSGITTATTRTWTLPDSSDTFVGKATTDTLTNKTIDTAGPNTIKINGNTLSASSGTATVTIPNSTATLAALNLADQTMSGGANFTSSNQGTKSTGTFTVDCGACALQFITNNGAFTLAAPANDGACMLLITNGASAGAITFSGFTVSANTGDALTTTNGSKFMLTIMRINSVATYSIKALQ